MTYDEIMAESSKHPQPFTCNNFKPQPVRVQGEEWKAEFCAHCGRHKEKHIRAI